MSAESVLNETLKERERESGRNKHEEVDNRDYEAPRENNTDTVVAQVDDVQFEEEEIDTAKNLQPVLAPNAYVGKRNFIHQLMDVALMMANVSQLKALLVSENNQYYYLILTFFCLSICLQVIFTICMLVIWSIEKKNLKNNASRRQY